MARINETIELPSNGKIYPLKEITIQNMTVAEEKFLWGSTNENAIDEILKKCIVNSDVDVDDLIVADKYYILVRLRILTYGPTYPVDLVCRSCGSSFTETIDLTTLEVDKLDDDYKEPIKITLPVSKMELELHIPSSGEINRLNKLAERKAERFNLDKDELDYIYNLMLGIGSVNGDDKVVEDELFEIIKDLPGGDSSYLKHEFNKIKVGYYTRLSCNCPKCKKKVSFRLPMNADFFLTSYEDE